MLSNNESLSEKFIRKGFWIYLFSFICAPIGYILKIIFSYNLTIEELWVLYGVISFIWLLQIYHDLGMTESLNFFLPKYIVKNDWKRVKSLMSYALVAQIISSSIIATWLYFWSSWIAIHYFHTALAKPVLEIFCFFFLWMNAFQMTNTFFGAVQNTKSQKWTEFIRMIWSLVFTLLAWKFGHGNLIVYAWSWVIGLILGILYSLFSFYKNYYIPYLSPVKAVLEKPLLKEVVSYAFWVLIAANVWWILSQIDMQFIIYFLWSEQAGYYTNYLSMIGMPYLFITPIIVFMFPVVSELHGRWDTEKISTIKNLFYKYFSVISIATSIFLFVFAKELSIVLFGNKFAFSGEIMMFSSLFLIFNILLQINFQILGGIGKAQGRARILWVGLFVNIILNLILIPLFGSRGSSLAVGLSWIPLWIMSLQATKQFPLHFDWKFFIKNALWMWLLGTALYFGKNLFHIIAFGKIWLLAILLIIAGIYLGIFILMNFREWKLFFDQLKQMRRKPKQEPRIDESLENTIAG